MYKRIEQVLDFAINNINQIDLTHSDWNESIGPHICFADKVVIETALLTLMVNRTCGNEFEQQLHTLGKAICPFVRNEKNLTTLKRLPQSAAVFGIGHAALCTLGFPDDQFDKLIKRAFQTGEVFNTERLPYRKMDVQWLHNLIFPSSPIALDETLRHTILMSTAHPIYMAIPDIYALTHSLMYITDFGTTAVPQCVNAQYISSVINSACAYHLLSDNLDVLGELIMSNILMQNNWSPHVELGMVLLTGIWDELGFLPCPTFDAGAYQLLQGKAASSYAFRHLYHTTYVGGILCCLLLNYNNVQKRSQSADLSIERRFDLITNCIREQLPRRGSVNFMLSLLDKDPSYKNEAVLAVLIDALLIHAIQDYDLPFLSRMLSFVTTFEIAPTVTINKSIEFLTNQ